MSLLNDDHGITRFRDGSRLTAELHGSRNYNTPPLSHSSSLSSSSAAPATSANSFPFDFVPPPKTEGDAPAPARSVGTSLPSRRTVSRILLPTDMREDQKCEDNVTSFLADPSSSQPMSPELQQINNTIRNYPPSSDASGTATPCSPKQGPLLNLHDKNMSVLQAKELRKICPDLEHVHSLKAADNLISTIPTSLLECLHELRILDLRNNALTSLNVSIALCCPLLEEIHLNNNELVSLPSSVCDLKHLKILSCSSNKLTCLPYNIGQRLSELTVLKVDKNRILEIPPSVGFLPSLRILDISLNHFSTIPASLGKLTSLTSLGLEWFRYCSPSLPRFITVPDGSLIFDRFRTACAMASNHGIHHIKFLHLLNAMSGKDVNPNGVDRRGRTRLHVAALEGHVGVVRGLVQGGAPIDALDADSLSPLLIAVREGKQDIVTCLCEMGANVDNGGGLLGSSLHVAIVNFDVNVSETLIKKNADVNFRDGDGNTPLHVLMSVFDKMPSKAKTLGELLVKNNADCNAVNNDLWAPLHLAARRDQTEGIQFMIETRNKAARMCLQSRCNHRAHPGGKNLTVSKSRNTATAKNKKQSSSTGNTGREDEHQTSTPSTGVGSPCQTTGGDSPGSKRYNNDNKVKHQESNKYNPQGLSKNVSSSQRCSLTFDLNIQGGSHGWTALHLAGHACHINVLMKLIAAGANVLLRNHNGRTPRQVARGNMVASKILRNAEDEWLLLQTSIKLRDYLKYVDFSTANSSLSWESVLPMHKISVSTRFKETINRRLLMPNQVATVVRDNEQPIDSTTNPFSKTEGDVSSSRNQERFFIGTVSAMGKPEISRLAVPPRRALGDVDVMVSDTFRVRTSQTPSSLTEADSPLLQQKPLGPASLNDAKHPETTHCEAIQMLQSGSVLEEDKLSSAFSGLQEFRVLGQSSLQLDEDTQLKNRQKCTQEELAVLKNIAKRCQEMPFREAEWKQIKQIFGAPSATAQNYISEWITSLQTSSATQIYYPSRLDALLLSFFTLKSTPLSRALLDEGEGDDNDKSSTQPKKAETLSKALRIEGLHFALSAGFEDLVRSIVGSFGADWCTLSDIRTEEKETLLHSLSSVPRSLKYSMPAKTSKADLLLYLLQLHDCRWDINAHDSRGLRPIHLAAKNGDLGLVQLLLMNGADPNVAENTTGWTPLHFATSNSHYAVITQLLYHPNINPDIEDYFHWSPLLEAINCLDLRAVALLVNRGSTLPLDRTEIIGNPKRLENAQSALKLEAFFNTISSNGLVNQFRSWADNCLAYNNIKQITTSTNGALIEPLKDQVQKSDIVYRCNKKKQSSEQRVLLGVACGRRHRMFRFYDGAWLFCFDCLNPVVPNKRNICALCGVPVCSKCIVTKQMQGGLLFDLERKHVSLNPMQPRGASNTSAVQLNSGTNTNGLSDALNSKSGGEPLHNLKNNVTTKSNADTSASPKSSVKKMKEAACNEETSSTFKELETDEQHLSNRNLAECIKVQSVAESTFLNNAEDKTVRISDKNVTIASQVNSDFIVALTRARPTRRGTDSKDWAVVFEHSTMPSLLVKHHRHEIINASEFSTAPVATNGNRIVKLCAHCLNFISSIPVAVTNN